MTYVDVGIGDNQVAIVTLNRPERLNALGATLVAEATAAFKALSRDRAVSAVVLTGAGRGFCSGADLSGERDPAPDSEDRGPVGRVHRSQEHIVELILAVHECEKPVVNAAHGAAVGGGLAWPWRPTCGWPRPPPASARSSSRWACRRATWA